MACSFEGFSTAKESEGRGNRRRKSRFVVVFVREETFHSDFRDDDDD